MNTLQKRLIQAMLISFLFGTLCGFCIGRAHAAELPIPKHHRRPPELCLKTGREPFAGQTLMADPRCPTKLRWRFQK